MDRVVSINIRDAQTSRISITLFIKVSSFSLWHDQHKAYMSYGPQQAKSLMANIIFPQ